MNNLLPPEVTELIINLINSDTTTIIERMAKNVLANPEAMFSMTSFDTYQLAGIVLLAVDDAKTSDRPASANGLYQAVFNKTKELLNNV